MKLKIGSCVLRANTKTHRLYEVCRKSNRYGYYVYTYKRINTTKAKIWYLAASEFQQLINETVEVQIIDNHYKIIEGGKII